MTCKPPPNNRTGLVANYQPINRRDRTMIDETWQQRLSRCEQQTAPTRSAIRMARHLMEAHRQDPERGVWCDGAYPSLSFVTIHDGIMVGVIWSSYNSTATCKDCGAVGRFFIDERGNKDVCQVMRSIIELNPCVGADSTASPYVHRWDVIPTCEGEWSFHS